MSNKIINFTVFSQPIPQPRPKGRRIGAGIQIYTPASKKIAEYKDTIRNAFLKASLSIKDKTFLFSDDYDIKLTVRYFLKRPQDLLSTNQTDDALPHTRLPDLDNLLKGTMDALTGFAWKDDSRVFDIVSSKRYCRVAFGGKSGRKRISHDPCQVITIEYIPS